MEKAGLLIERLFEQYRSQASKEQLRITTQLLLYELEKEVEEPEGMHNVVSIFFPAASHYNVNTSDVEPLIAPERKKMRVISGPEVNEDLNTANEESGQSFFDPMVEIPTLALKKQEINETIASQKESLNDKLKSASSQKEVGNTIKTGPIKDLRKAIGINDQYLFINELFRGDQTMYERSIKTINGFNIYGEAELWIKRELKLKLGWNESSEVVHLFDQLVKRRFS